jgi:hypothetical protein
MVGLGYEATQQARTAAFGPARYGAVLMKDWARDPVTGTCKIGYVGTITFIETSDLGVEKPGDHSWCLKVEHPDNPESHVFVLGCQIRAVRFYPERLARVHSDFDTLET